MLNDLETLTPINPISMDSPICMGYHTSSHLPMVYDAACLGARNPGHTHFLAPCAGIRSLRPNASFVITLRCRECGTNPIGILNLVKNDNVILVLHLDNREHTSYGRLLTALVAHPINARFQFPVKDSSYKRKPRCPLFDEIDIVVKHRIVLV